MSKLKSERQTHSDQRDRTPDIGKNRCRGSERGRRSRKKARLSEWQ